MKTRIAFVLLISASVLASAVLLSVLPSRADGNLPVPAYDSSRVLMPMVMTPPASADEQLRRSMHLTSEWVDNFYEMMHRLPTDDELAPLRASMPPNPYTGKHHTGHAPARVQVELAVNDGISCLELGEGRRATRGIERFATASYKDKSTVPGTITVITNAKNRFLVVGTGRDGEAVGQQTAGKPLFYFTECPM